MSISSFTIICLIRHKKVATHRRTDDGSSVTMVAAASSVISGLILNVAENAHCGFLF